MSALNWKNIRETLAELSDRELQRRLWTSDGTGGSDVSSFAEAVEQLFTDTGLADVLDSGGTGLGAEIDGSFHLLEKELRKVDARQGPMVTIDHPAMTNVRRIAGDLVRVIPDNVV